MKKQLKTALRVFQIKLFIIAAIFVLVGGSFLFWKIAKDTGNDSSYSESSIINQPASDLNDYFPLAIGNQWRYKVKIGALTAEDLIFQIAYQDEINEKLTYVLQDTNAVQSENYEKTPEAVLVHKRNDQMFDPPQPIILFPLSAGAQKNWQEETGISGELKIVKEETVRVPAGKFKAWRIQIEKNDNKGDLISRSIRWFAPGIGMIKEESAITVSGKKIKFLAELAEYHLK
ncbi:MAG: hypothetical protein Q8L57_01315 [bacterium]|nr:hypothetical protein [bacterium]